MSKNWNLDMAANSSWLVMMQTGIANQHVMELKGLNPVLAEAIYEIYKAGFKNGTQWRDDTSLKI